MKNSTFSAQVANNLLTVLQGYSKTIRLLLVMFLTLTVTTNAWGATWEKATSIAAGDVVLLVCESKKMELSSISTTSTKYGIGVAYTTSPAGAYELTVEAGNSSGTYSLKNGSNYLYWSSGNSLATNTTKSANTSWSITFNNGNATIKNATDATRIIGWNASSPRFACYTSSQTAVQLYKKVTAVQTVAVTGVSLNPTSLTLTVGNSETLTATVLPNNATDKTITWSTSNSSVATVSDGKVTAVAEGSAIITVTTNDGKKTATCNVTVNPKPKYTVTLVPGSGTCAASVTESSAGAGVTLPTPTLDGCGEWSFAGWTTSSVANETSSKPATLLTGTYKPTSNITLYAVYQRTEETEGNGGETEVTNELSFANTNQRTSYSTTKQVWEQNGITLTNDKSSSTSNVGDYSNPARFYKSSKITITAPGNITKIQFNCVSSYVISIDGATTSGNTVTVTLNGTSDTYTISSLSAQVRFSSLSVTYTTTSAGGTITTTYYHSTPDCGGSTPDPDPTYYTITLNPNYPAGKTGVFTDKEGNTVNGNLVISLPEGTKTQPIADLYSSISLDGYIFEGWFEVTAEGEENHRVNTGTITNDTTFYAHWKLPYTVTFDAGTGTCTESSITETTADGIKLPTATLEDCGDWVFLGWAEAAIASETTTAPASILSGGSTYKPTADITLHAIYKRVEGGGGESATLTFDDTSKRTTFTNDQQVWTENGITLTNNKASSTTNVGDYADPARFYKSSEIIISAPDAITQIVATTPGGDYLTALVNSVGTEASANENVVTITPTESNATYTIQLIGGQVRLSSITVTYGGGLSTSYYHSNPVCTNTPVLTVNPSSLAFGNVTVSANKEMTFTLTGSDLTANATLELSGTNASMFSVNPTSVTQSAGSIDQTITVTYAPTAAGNHTATLTISSTDAESKTVTLSGVGSNPPTWQPATINFEGIIQVACGSTTVLNPADPNNGPATITFNGYDLQDSVKVTASEGFLVSTDKTTAGKYTTELTVNPHKDGNNIGKIQNVYVIAQAPAQSGDYTGTITLTGNDIPGGSQVINVTAAVTCTQYTITWSVNGDDSHKVTYSPGDALQLPEIDITPCDGMDHVGWTDNMGYDHGTDILFTETTDMTVTSDKTYYAVFAASTSSGGGEITLDFSQQGYANQEKVSSLEQDGITVTFDKGTGNTDPAYYESGTAIRVYAKGTFTVSTGNTISKIVITFGTSDKTNEITTNNGTYSDGTWTGSANSVIFTVGGTKDHRRIKSITVTSAGGGAGYYTGHTTTCSGSQQLATPTNLNATDITYNGATLTWDAVAGANKYKVVINGTEYISNTNSYTTHDLKQQTAYTWTVQAIGNGTTFTDSEISAEATFTTGTALVITWSVSTATSTTTITKGQPIGANLKTPATPTACEGKDFMGWSASSTVNSDGSDFTPITSDIIPETNVTYYAVFATKEVGDGVALTQCNGSTTFEAGDNIVIVASGDGWSYLCYQETSGTTYIVNHEFINDATTLINDDKNYWTLETANGGFYLGDNTNGYMYLPNSNDLCVSTDNKSIWTIEWNAETSAFNIKSDRWLSCRSDLSTTNKYKWRGGGTDGKSGTTNLQIYKISGSTSYTDYSTSCGTYTITFYGFNSGGYTTICGNNPAEIAVAQGETYQIPDCEPTFDPAGLGRTFTGTWNTQADGKGTAYEPGDKIVNVSNDITLYAQWALNTSESTTLPTDVEDLATTDIVVTGGTTLTLAAGTTTINSLTLKGGLQADGSYAMPIVKIPTGATLVRNNTTINLDLVVNSDSWYPFAVPFAATNNANVEYLDPTLAAASTYGTHFAIKTYDGARRAEEGVDQTNNWVQLKRNEKLQPGVGYIISALTYPDKDTATIRIPMSVSNDWLANGELTTVNEVTRNAVEVTAYTGAAATEHQRHAGWNFVANPYLANFAGTNASGSFINGEIIINKGDYSYGGDDVPYVTIPTYNFAHYYQVKLSEATLSPAYSFFVQVGTDGTMTFDVAGRQQAPASIAARSAEERPVKMDVDITLSDNHSSDQTGIIISDRYSEAYEIGRDLEKLFGSAYNLSVYTLMADNTPLAFQALAIRSNMQVIPVGYRAPEQGEYTFRLNEATSSIDLLNEQYEQLVLVDYQTGELTNLLIADYTFYSERTQADNRFAIYAVPRQNAPTDLPNAIGQDKQAQKIIHNGHLYILRDGNVYNGNGQIVK